mmetsp:Transcript_48781/g.96240  ORF Transcript_48781/g.96240 Transcript_48781/m.96240 type:complete len:84 (-) Transcript_48781:581-832(-)
MPRTLSRLRVAQKGSRSAFSARSIFKHSVKELVCMSPDPSKTSSTELKSAPHCFISESRRPKDYMKQTIRCMCVHMQETDRKH